jgi:hypothetical protein
MTTEQDYQQSQQAIALETVAAVSSAYASVSAAFTIFDFASFSATAIAAQSACAAALSDAYVSGLLNRPAVGVGVPEDTTERLHDVLVSVVVDDHEEDPIDRLVRIARAEPTDAGRQAAQQSMQEHGVKSYRWETESDPCPRCVLLASHPWNVEASPESHPNCDCVVLPV